MKNRVAKILKVVISPAFIILLVISSVLWLISRLSHNYSTITEIEVSITTDYNSNLWIDNHPIKVKALVQGDGRDLMLNIMGLGGDPTTIPLSMLTLRQEPGAATYLYRIDEQSMERALASEQSKFTIMMITDTMRQINVSPIAEARIEIKSNISTHCAPQYTVNDNILLTPDSISIKAPLAVLDTLKYISTESLHLDDLREHTSGVVKLNIPPYIVSSVDMIRYSIDVVSYTELSCFLSVQSHSDTHIITIPTQVEVKAKVPLGAVEASLDDVKAYISNTAEGREGTIYRVELKGIPHEAIEWSITPEFVEVYFL